MIDNEKRAGRVQQKEKVRRRMQVKVDPNKYRYIPAKKKSEPTERNRNVKKVYTLLSQNKHNYEFLAILL